MLIVSGKVSQTHPEVCFTYLLGTHNTIMDDNQNQPSLVGTYQDLQRPLLFPSGACDFIQASSVVIRYKLLKTKQPDSLWSS